MRVRTWGLLTALGVILGSAPGTASACHACRRTPCVYTPPAPAFTCVTDYVPYTVCRVVPKVEWKTITETVMVPEANTTFVERQRTICRPVFDTTYVKQTITVCKPVCETTTVTQNVTVCKPVTTTQQVTEYCWKPTTQYVTVPVATRQCGHCGKAAPACGCATVAQTCLTPVPVVRDVQVTQMVSEVQTRQIPVTTTRIVPETKTIDVPLVRCRMVSEVITEKCPITTVRCVPKTFTRTVPVPGGCETITETRYRPVTRMVPCGPVAPVSYAAPQTVPSSQSTPSGQSAPSSQG